MRRQSIRIGLALVVAALIAGFAPADMGHADSSPAAVMSYEPSKAELEDLAVFAEARGIALDQAVAQIGWQPAFAEYVGKLRSVHRDFTGAQINDDGSVTIAFKDEVPGAVLSDRRLDGLEVRFVNGVGSSEEELWRQQDEVHASLVAAGFSDAAVGYHPIAGRIIATAALAPALGTGVVIPTPARADNVDLEITEGPLTDPDASLYGGARIEKAGSGALECTAAFKVQKGSTTGFVTAGHCITGTHENFSGATEYSATLQFPTHVLGQYGDYEWYTTTQTEKDDFYRDYGILRDLSGVGGIPVSGQTLLRFGQANGDRSDTVLMNRVVNGNGLWWVVMAHRYASGGDSGGPLFWGNTGWGVHFGGILYSGQWRDMYSRLDLVDEALGVSVSTNG